MIDRLVIKFEVAELWLEVHAFRRDFSFSLSRGRFHTWFAAVFWSVRVGGA
jgi:hypothetical protein